MRVPELCLSISVDLLLVNALVGFVLQPFIECGKYSVVLIAISDVRVYICCERKQQYKVQSRTRAAAAVRCCVSAW